MQFGEKEKRAIIVGIIIFVIIIILGFIINYKEKTKKPDIPYDTKDAKELKVEIDEIYKKHKTKDNVITYEDYKDENIYSLLIIIKDNSELGDYIVPKYISYNYDSKSNIIIDKEKIAARYGYTLDLIHDKIEERFKSWYQDEIKLGYVDSNECDFDECYLSYYRNIDSIDEYELFVKDNKLYAYLGFDKNSFQDDIEYFEKLEYDPFVMEL